ncbi:TonB-dependent receptor [Parapedobacter defluvii]|uniref:TonB-dependent receptor n=1 Tax=Parapedobacter defluvii TaxID=2045106 RepID=UPI000F93D5AE|nr:TonB-dependent receptor [Parapedobacter defluvii]RQP17563.1 MAG: TonB-dependent receptor [Parapedobacter sp.]
MQNNLRLILITILCIWYSSQSNAQSSSLSGKVVSISDHIPLRGVTVRINELSIQQVTNANGNFQFNNLPIGRYILSFSMVGFESKKIETSIPVSTDDLFLIELQPSETVLQTVEILGRDEQSYKNTSSFVGTKTETPIKDDPQAISYVTKELIDDQQAFKPSDILKNISSVNTYSYYNNDISIRGFRAGGALVNGLRSPTNSWSQTLLANVERVEVVKGPSSIFYGDSDPGGTVNTVTKKPLVENRKSVDFSTGSYNTFRLKSDFTGPMNEQKTLLYRLNLAYQNAESFRVLQGGEDMLIAPSFSFLPNDRTRVNVDFVYSKAKSRLDRGQPIFGGSAGTQLNSTPISFAIAKQNDFMHELNMNSTLSIQHKFSDHVSINASYMKVLYDEDLLEHRTSNNYAVDEAGQEIPTLMQMQTIRRKRKSFNDNISLYLVNRFKTGPLEHRMTAGYDYIQNVVPIGGSTFNAAGYRNADNTGVISRYNKDKPELYLIEDGMPVPNVPHFDLTDPDYSISEISSYINDPNSQSAARTFQHGIFFQDQIAWGPVKAVLALRQGYYTNVRDYKQDDENLVRQRKFIPRIGLVYTPIQPVSIYANYTQGYQPQSANIVADPERYGGPFEPMTSKSFEGGVKTEFFNKLLAINTAIYHIEKNNILIDANDDVNPDLRRQIGQQRSRGIELDVNGQILSNLSITANVAINNTVITKSDDPAEEGKRMPNAPKHKGGIWAKYTFKLPALNGVGIAAGANYISERNTQNAALILPSYVVADAALYYAFDKFRITANLNNVFNKTHWVGGYDYNRLFPGTPRNFLVGVGYTF